MATAEQWMKCTQAQKDELNELYSVRNRYVFRRKHMLTELDKARKLVLRTVNYSWGELWVHPVHVRYEAARDVARLTEWMNTDGVALAHR